MITNLRDSRFVFLANLFREKTTRTGSMRRPPSSAGYSRRRPTLRDNAKLSVSANFKVSLLDLMRKMQNAQPHFVRCIKPNDMKVPHSFSHERVQQQLRYTGVLETTRIRRDGFSIRMSFADFLNKYQTLAFKGEDLREWSDDEETKTLRAGCQRIIKRCSLKGAQLGALHFFPAPPPP